MKEYQDYYVNIKWMCFVIPVLGVGIYEVFRYHIFTKYFDELTNSIILMTVIGFFGFIFSTWLFKKIQGIHNTLFWEQQRLKTIFNHTSDGIIVLGENCIILDINPAAEELTKWKAKDVIGKMTCDEMMRCSKSKEACWNSSNPNCCLNVDCGHRECWGKTCLEKKISVPFVEMCLARKNGELFRVAASYSYIPAVGEEKPQVKLVLRDISKRKELEKAIQNYATLEERYRLAREMHDGLAQALVYLNIKAHSIQKSVEQSNKDRALRDLKEFRQIAQDAVNEVRQNIFDLKTPPKEETSCFKIWIEDYLKYFETKNHIKTELNSNFFEPLVLSTETKVQVIRIIQEAFTNIRKHARATRASICLNKIGDNIIFQILDNGQGIKDEAINNNMDNFGLCIMQERAHIIGGKLEVRRNKPSGTLVELQVPIINNNISHKKLTLKGVG